MADTNTALETRIEAIRAHRVPGIMEHLTSAAGDYLGEIGDIRRARRRGVAGEERLSEIVEAVAGWPSGLRDQILDRVQTALKVRVR